MPINKKSLEDTLGSKVSLTPLQPSSVRKEKLIRHIKRKAYELNPMTWLVQTPEGRLVMFDLGGFQQGRIIDEFFVGHPISKTIDRKAFLETYLEHGGRPNLFDREPYVRALNDIRMAAFFSEVSTRFSRLEWRRRHTYRHWAQEKTARMLELTKQG